MTTIGNSLIGLTAILLCTGPWVGSASAQSQPRAEFVQRESEDVVLPGFEPGKVRSRIQLVWDADAWRIIRRKYEIWDGLASRDYDLFWFPNDPQGESDGPISGEGSLVWRLRDALSYDQGANIAEFRGRIVNGRAEGAGEYIHKSGAAFRGAWKNGLMDGSGRLWLPNGDQYVGSFRAGRRSGFGTYIDSTGEVYEGGFNAGLREGAGIVLAADGETYQATWRMDNEIAGTRSIRKQRLPIRQAQAQNNVGVRLSVNVDRRALFGFGGIRQLQYVAESTADTLKVFPDDTRLLDVWKGRMPIQVADDEYDFTEVVGLGFLGPATRFKPVGLEFDVENLSRQPLQIVGAFLDVENSAKDVEPALQLVNSPAYYLCGNQPPHPVFSFENFGWTDAEEPTLRVDFISTDGRTIGPSVKRELAPVLPRSEFVLNDEPEIDLEPDLRRNGLNIDYLTNNMECQGPSLDACINERRRLGIFGPYADAVSLTGRDMFLSASGTLDYRWRDSVGAAHSKTSTFQTDLYIGTFHQDAECGEGGNREEPFLEPFKLQLDQSGYRVTVPISEEIPSGVIARWRLRLDADQTSNHQFRLVLLLANGREIASRPIELLYFKPSALPLVAEDTGSEEDSEPMEGVEPN